MEEQGYTSTDLYHLFRMEQRFKSQQVLSLAEGRGDIPTAERIPRGKSEIRKWRIDSLPEIGKRFGFISNKKMTRQVISVFTQKGGTLKTTLSHALARILALHGYRIILIGLDVQCSITSILLPTPEVESLEALLTYNDSLKGLYNFFSITQPAKRNISEIIRKTDLPTLDIIPETPELSELSELLGTKTGREYRFKQELLPYLDEYDIVIFDNGPNWNQLVKNSLAASETLIQPIGCDVGTLQVLDKNIASIEKFKKDLLFDWKNWFLVPTLKENTKLSQQIYAAYIAKYPASKLTTATIKRTVAGQEALFLNKTALEYAPRSPLAQEYGDLVKEVWERITQIETKKQHRNVPTLQQNKPIESIQLIDEVL